MERCSLIYVCFITAAKYVRSEDISTMHLEYQSEKQTIKNAPSNVNFYQYDDFNLIIKTLCCNKEKASIQQVNQVHKRKLNIQCKVLHK